MRCFSFYSSCSDPSSDYSCFISFRFLLHLSDQCRLPTSFESGIITQNAARQTLLLFLAELRYFLLDQNKEEIERLATSNTLVADANARFWFALSIYLSRQRIHFIVFLTPSLCFSFLSSFLPSFLAL
jgi:hypothetical protein